MEKYYVGQLNDLKCNSINKLVEVRYSRRPSTFGVLYVVDSRDAPAAKGPSQRGVVRAGKPVERWLKLATLSLTLDNRAKFVVVKEIKLEQTNNDPVVDFDTLTSGQLLIEGSSSTGNEQFLQSSIFLLTLSGRLLIVSMIDHTSRELLRAHSDDNRKTYGRLSERFVQVIVSRQKEVTPQIAPKETGLTLLTLSERCLNSYTIMQNQIDSTLQGCSIRLNYQHLIDDKHDETGSSSLTQHPIEPRMVSQHDNKRRREFVRMLPMASGGMILLEANDGSLFVLNQANPLASFPQLCSGGSQSLFFFPRTSPDEPHILLVLTRNNKLVAHSLIIATDEAGDGTTPGSYHAVEGFSNMESSLSQRAARSDQEESVNDPDQLIPEEPKLELEECWSINLNEIDGVRPMFDDDDDDNDDDGDANGENEDNHNQTTSGITQPTCLCLPIWPATSTPTKKASLLDDGTDIAAESITWPRLLLVICRHSVLMFNFEQATVLPFSVVYDRAFLNLTATADGSQSAPVTSDEQFKDKRVDLRLKPRLLHNAKLVGTRPSDSLFNMLFLTCKIHLAQARDFNQLGLLAAVSNMGHIVVFKLTSAKLKGPNQKDNLYQQLLVDSLSDPSLLQEEVARMSSLESDLKARVKEIEAEVKDGAQNADRAQAGRTKPDLQVADLLAVRIFLEPHESDAGLYNLNICWPNLLLDLTKVTIVSTVENSKLLEPVSDTARARPKNLEIVKPKIELTLVEEGQQIELEQTLRTPTAAREHVPNAIKARAFLKLFPQSVELSKEDTSEPEVGTQTSQINVPVSLDDFKVGKLEIFLVFGLMPIEFQYGSVAQTEFTRNSYAYKFIKQEINIKPLNSYVSITDDALDEQKCTQLFVQGEIGIERALVWLNELVNIHHEMLPKVTSDQVTLTFRSSSRLCLLRAQLTMKSMTFLSDDIEALQHIKQHILSRATDDSVQVKLDKTLK